MIKGATALFPHIFFVGLPPGWMVQPKEMH